MAKTTFKLKNDSLNLCDIVWNYNNHVSIYLAKDDKWIKSFEELDSNSV